MFIIWFGLKDDPVSAPSTQPAVDQQESVALTLDEPEREFLKDTSVAPGGFMSINMQNSADFTETRSIRSKSITLATLPRLYETQISSTRRRRHSAPAAFHYEPAAPADPVVSTSTKTYSMFAATLFVVLNGTSRGCLAVAETYGADLYYQVQFGKDYTRDEVSTMNEAWFYTGLGAVGVLVFLGMHRLTTWFSELTLLITGFCCLAVGFFSVVDPDHDLSLGTLIFGMSLLYIISTPINNTLCASMLSKECSPDKAGLMMGWLTAAGSLGRIVFPLISGAFYAGYGMNGALIFPAVIGLLSALAIVIALKTWITWYDSLKRVENHVMQLISGRQLVPTEDDDNNDDWQAPEDVYERQQNKNQRKKLRFITRSSSDEFSANEMARLRVDDSAKS